MENIMVVNNEGPFLKQTDSQTDNQKDYKGYKTWLNGINATGQQPQFDAASDLRIKKYVVDTFGNDDSLRKMLMLNFVGNGIIDKDLAQVYIMKKLVRGI